MRSIESGWASPISGERIGPALLQRWLAVQTSRWQSGRVNAVPIVGFSDTQCSGVFQCYISATNVSS